MNDKLYKKLNSRKPPISVLDKAEDELKAKRKNIKSRGVVLRWALSGAMSIVVIVVAVIIALNGGAFSSKSDKDASFNNMNNASAPESSGNDGKNESADEATFELGFDYEELENSAYGARAYITEGVEVRLCVLTTPSTLAGERVEISPLATVGIMAVDGDKTTIAFAYDGNDYLLEIFSTDADFVGAVISDIKIL